MNIGHLRPGTAKDVTVQRPEQPAEQEGVSKNGARIDVENGGDKLTISKEARELLSTDRTLREELEKLPGVRKEKIDLAMSRIHSGHYSREEVFEKVAEQLIDK